MDTKRKTIGLIFTGNENWIGGLYYIVNIVKAIGFIPKQKRPDVVIIYNNKTPASLLKEVNLSFVHQVNIDKIFLLKRLIFSTLFRVFKKNYLFKHIVKKHKIEILYPFNEYHYDLSFLPCKVYYWIFDFQHKFLPELFTKQEVVKRNNEFELMSHYANNIVVSSFTAKKHFQTYFPYFKGNLHVLRFASLIVNLILTDISVLNKKFDIKEPYFLVSNQFWIHKNHWVIAKALKQIKALGQKCMIIFTGKEHDPRNPKYVSDLKTYIDKNSLNDYTKFLGFISREDQLGLMKNCIAVIQPSKFEGWGTVVEDAKSLGVQVILSDIEIHREQLPEGKFFGVDDYNQLSKIILKFNSDTTIKSKTYIKEYYLKFSKQIIDIFNYPYLGKK